MGTHLDDTSSTPSRADGAEQAAVTRPAAVTAESIAARRWLIAALIAIAAHAALAWLAREPGLLTGQDDAEYITLSQSILQGGYNELYHVDAPLHRMYPPAYPAALALWSLAFGNSIDSLVLLSILCSVLSLAVLFFIVGRRIDRRIAALSVVVLAFNPAMLEYAGGIRSEPLYLLFSLLGIYWVAVADERKQWLGPAIAAILIAAATRSVGVTLLGAAGLHWLIDRRWKRVGVPVGAVALALLAWFIWSAAGPDQFVGTSYMAELRSMWRGTDWTGPLPGRAVRYAWNYAITGVPYQMALPTVTGTIIDNAIGVFLAGTLILAGMVTLMKRWRPAVLYVIVYSGLLLIWIFYVGRFVVPLVPLLVLAMLTGAATLGARWHRKAGLLAPALAAAILLAGDTMRTQALVQSRMDCDRAGRYPDPTCMSTGQVAFFDALRWIDANTPRDAVFLTAKTGPLYLYTGRRSIAYDAAIRQQPAEFIDWISEHGAGWILLGSVHHREPGDLAPLLEAACTDLELVAAFLPRALVLRVAETGSPGSDAACNAINTYRGAATDLDFGRRPELSGRRTSIPDVSQ